MNPENSQKLKQTNSPENSTPIPIVTNNKKCKKYFMIDPNTKVYFNADFDSGNLQKVQQITSYIYKLYPGYDKTQMSTQKTYFHFKVFGFQMCMVRFHIIRVHILEKLLRSGQENTYKPIVRKSKGKYEKIQKGINIYYNKQDEVELSIDYQFFDEDDWTQFAFSYPYSYEDMVSLVKELKVKYTNHPDIYFHEEVLGYSQEGRKLELITITEKLNCEKTREDKVDGLFPQWKQEEIASNKKSTSQSSLRPFKINKPKVIISGRVHPGQSPASYCVEGLLRFLLDQKDYRSYLLRKNFHFIIVPMLSLDGVYHGMFRSDLNGENLNRIYLNCSRIKHPTIWCFREYLKSLQNSEQPVLFYFDFHAHPTKKEFFIYGNAFSEFTFQVEAQTFGKLLQNNCPYFHNIDSVFSQKQMVSKERNDDFTKQGCARVYVHKLFNIIHSYTVECGYFAPGKLQKWQPPQIIQKQCQIFSEDYTYVDTWQQYNTNAYTPGSYMLMGKSILITILDLFHLNPFTRINLGQFKSIANIRKNVGVRIYNVVDRFRLVDSNVTKKLKLLNILLEEEYYKSKIGSFGLSISQNYGMKRPKRTYSLLSKVYLTKNQLTTKLKKLNLMNKEKQVIDIHEVKSLQNLQIYQQELQSLEQIELMEDGKQKSMAKIKINSINTQIIASSLNSSKDHKLDAQSKVNILNLESINFNPNKIQLKSHHEHSEKMEKIEKEKMDKQKQLINQTHHINHINMGNNHSIVNKNHGFNVSSLSEIRKMYENYRNLLQNPQKKTSQNQSLKSQRLEAKEEQLEQSLLSTKKKAISQINLQKHNSQKYDLPKKFKELQNNSTPLIKSERSQRTYSTEQKLSKELKRNEKTKEKYSKIESFLRKEANKTIQSNNKQSALEKYVTAQTNQLEKRTNQSQLKKRAGTYQTQSAISRFPIISARNFGNNKTEFH